MSVMDYGRTLLLLLINHIGYCLFHLARRLWQLICAIALVLLPRLSDRDGDAHDITDMVAQVLVIHARYKFDVMLSPCSVTDFIATPERWCPLDYVLRDDVTLYAISETEAVFVETTVDVHRSSCNAFMRVAQFLHAQRLVRIPLTSVHDLALLSLGITDRKSENEGTKENMQQVLEHAVIDKQLVFIGMTGRCGSTLLLQMFEATGRAVTFSEPEVLNTLAQWQNQYSAHQFRALVKSCVILLCKLKCSDADAYVFKMTPPTITIMPALQQLFPSAKFLFTYRNGLDVAKSSYKVAPQMPLIQMALLNAKFSARRAQRAFAAMGIPSDQFSIVINNNLAFFYYIWVTCVRSYRSVRQQHVDVVAVQYEQLQTQPLQCVRHVFRHCQFPCTDMQLNDIVTSIMSRDSQTASPISHAITSRNTRVVVTSQDLQVIDDIASKNDLPPHSAPCHLEGTITLP